MQALLRELSRRFPHLKFRTGKQFYWSPATQEVHYNPATDSTSQCWRLLHEVSHGLLGHQTYRSDLELLQLEVAAWEKASELAGELKMNIDENYIQDCLDTYRDWLDRRSACPYCTTRSTQEDSEHYRCFNCGSVWRVSGSRFCRTYRQVNRDTKKSPTKRQAIFS